MKPFRIIMMLSALMLVLPGCLYTHTRQPLTLDMHGTPIATVEKEGSLKLIAFPPIIGDYKLIAWGSAAIGDVAKKEGMREIYYADLEIFSVLRVWNEYTVHVYGK